jgi:hypothetical protein
VRLQQAAEFVPAAASWIAMLLDLAASGTNALIAARNGPMRAAYTN